MNIELRSVLAWLAVFLAYELCAHWRAPRPVVAVVAVAVVALVLYLWPIKTFSGTVWGGIHWWHPIADAVVALTIVLDIHFLWMVSAGYLIAGGAVVTIGVVEHWLRSRAH